MSENLTDLIGRTSNQDSASTREDPDSYSQDSQEELKILRAARYKADTESRKWLAQWAAVVVSLWLIAVLLILINNTQKKWGLTDTVLSVLLGTTTLNILGLMFIVLKGYFNGDEKPD